MIQKIYKNINTILHKAQIIYLMNLLKMIITKSIEVKNAFNGSYVLYESKGDKDSKLSIDQFFDIIRHYLKDLIDDYKSKDE